MSPVPPQLVSPRVQRLIVTIDGPAGTGKSSTSQALARALGLSFLNTGAMYRAAAALVLDAGVDPGDVGAVVRLVEAAKIRFDWSTTPPVIHASGRPLTTRLSDPDVTSLVAPLSSIPALRAVMVREQRRIAQEHPRLVTEGRDQGSVVFPDADVKFYLTASPWVRAQRRAAEIQRQRGECVDPHALRVEIEQRDRIDQAKPVGALVQPEGAVVVDTSEMTFEQAVLVLVRSVHQLLREREA